jgi:hypothetical protein
MESIFKRIVVKDTWIDCANPPGTNLVARIKYYRDWILPPIPRGEYQFKNYALGFRWLATPHEIELMQTNDILGKAALQLHDNFHPLTLADLIGPEFIPEVNLSEMELLRVEARVREAAIGWTHFLEGLETGN